MAFVFYRLLQLNLHRILVYSFKLHQEFKNLKDKNEGSFIFGKQFVADSAIGIVETLDKIIFHLNAVSGGRDIDLFSRLDRLKGSINKCFEKEHIEKETEREKDDITGGEDEVLVMLKRILSYTSEMCLSESPVEEINIEDCTAAHDLLLYCFKRIFNILDDQLGELRTGGFGTFNTNENINEIAINWLNPDEKLNFDRAMVGGKESYSTSKNPGVIKLTEGIKEVMESDLYNSVSAGNDNNSHHESLIIHSPDTITFYHLTPRFKTVLTSNVCNATTGNYIYLLIIPTKELQPAFFYNLLIEKLLHWLDFSSFNSHDTIISSIKNMTFDQLEDYLNMIGKMLSFISSPKISPEDDSMIQQNIEFFLENIV